MKGSGAGYGLDRITEIGAAIEHAAKQQESLRVQELVQTLAHFLTRATIVYD